jgi:hypothetical protein
MINAMHIDMTNKRIPSFLIIGEKQISTETLAVFATFAQPLVKIWQGKCQIKHFW